MAPCPKNYRYLKVSEIIPNSIFPTEYVTMAVTGVHTPTRTPNGVSKRPLKYLTPTPATLRRGWSIETVCLNNVDLKVGQSSYYKDAI